MRDDKETKCSENILTFVKVILIRSPYYGGRWSPNSLSLVTKGGFQLRSVELVVKGVTWTSQKPRLLLTQTGSGVPLLRTIPIQLMEHGKVRLMSSWNIYLYFILSLVQKDFLQVTKRETKIQTQSQTFDL